MGEESKRGNWSNWLEFLFSTIGCLVGLGNVWRFPYVCYSNGGAAFLIPFLIAMVICGVPLFLLEMSICQYSNLGPGRVWIMCPLFKGIGYGMVVLTSIVALYYNVIISWALYYMAMSFSGSLPWATCDNWWNTNHCVPVGFRDVIEGNVTSVLNVTLTNLTTTMTSVMGNTSEVAVTSESSVVEFWIRNVLQATEGIESLGEIRWQLMLCLLATWVVIFFCLFKDIKTSGKVVYVAAVLPYVILMALLIRGSLLPGALEGVKYYLFPEWHRLLDFQGGNYALTLCDWYVASISVMLLAVGEVLVIAWVYGSSRLYADIEMMIGYRPNPVWHVFWKVISPGFVLVLWVMGMIGWKPLASYPEWTQGVGWIIALLPLLPIPIMAAVQLFSSSGTLGERLRFSIKPSPEWRPALPADEEDDVASHHPLKTQQQLEQQHRLHQQPLFEKTA
ncbi:sodium- and chloride-dependent GABA transporter 3-like [Littorina saxatilis]|uniref:Transporter n=1 Tax=Littorina saxatilis TaxID=31220 RepID=A0AAN9G513_9CAEN